MATGGLYGSSGTGALIAQPGSESSGLYGNSTSFGGTYFEWFVFQTSETQPATPTGGTWNFTTNANTPPTGWSSTPPSNPLNTVWVSIAIVNSKNTAPLVWSVPGKFAFSSGLPILFGDGAPQPGDGQSDQLYIQLDTTPQTIWAKETGTWTRLTGSTLYADLTSNQTIAGTKTFSSQIQGSISGTASNVTGTVAISNGGTGATTAASARAALGAAELGANADITSMTGVTGGISTPDFVQFDTGITPTVGVGKLQWDPTHGCMQVGLVGGNVNLQIGEETVAYVYNNTGSTITEGQVVRVVGSQGQRLTVALAQADEDSNSATILGMATENIANNSSGFITTQGVVNNLDTNGFADGTLLYLSPTVPGGVTATKPVAPQHLVWIGYVVKGNSGGAGSIYIHTQNGYEIDELHNVKITDPVADNSFLVYDATLEVWQNEAPSAARTSLELGSAAVLNAGSANGVATLDAGGTVPLSQIPASIQGGVSYQGTWNATTNTPTLTSSVGTKGYYYVVSVAGSTNLNGITSWNIGDWAIYNGTAWEKIDNTDAVTSVNGYTGTVVLNYADVGAPSTTGVNATGTWGINVTGNAATATTSTNVSGGTASVTTLTTSSTVTHNGGTANGVAYLNGSKVLTTGSALTFDGFNQTITAATNGVGFRAKGSASSTNIDATTSRGGTIGLYNLDTTNGNTSAVEFYNSNELTSSYISGVNVSHAGRTGAMVFGIANGAAPTEQMRLTSTGLGIGTSSPGSKLTVSSTGSTIELKQNGTGSATYYVMDNTIETGGKRWRFGYTGGAGIPTFSLLNQTDNVLAWAADSSGNLGIGTSSPISIANYKVITLDGTSGSGVLCRSNGTNGLYSYSTPTTSVVSEQRNLPLVFETNGTERMRLDSSGNLGLGVTPSAWTTFKVMQLGNYGAVGGVDSTSMNMFANTFYDGAFKRINAAASTRYRMDEGHSWFTAPSGTAGNAISFSQVMTLDASGRLMIGTTTNQTAATMLTIVGSSSSGSTLYVQGATNTQSGQIGGTITVRDSTAAVGVAGLSGISFTSGPGTDFRVGKYYSGSGSPRFVIGDTAAALGTDFVSVDSSGNLLVGTQSTSTTSGGFTIQPASGQSYSVAGHVSGTGSGAYFYACTYNGSVIGGITQNGTTGVSLTTSSDYRLKENIQPMTGALARVQALKPVTYKWKVDGSDGEGFIAHELQAVVPQCVTGEKDAVDAEGKPVYQGIDTSFLVATLTAAIQEQQAIINSLKARLDAANL